MAFGLPIGIGAGVFVSKQGHIITNYHVAEPALVGPFNLVIRTADGRVFSGDQIQVHGCGDRRRLDLCLLRVDAKPTRHFQVLGLEKRDSSLRKGDRIRVLGHPKGLGYTLSEGIIAGFRRLEINGAILDDRDPSGFDAVQITAPISPGNSGGPVFTEDGKLVGLSTFIFAPEDSQNLNMAIRTNEIATFFRRTVRERPMALGPYFERAQELGHLRYEARIEKELMPVYQFIKAGRALPPELPFFQYQKFPSPGGVVQVPIPTFARCERDDTAEAAGVSCETDEGDHFGVMIHRSKRDDIRGGSGATVDSELVEELQRLPASEILKLERSLAPQEAFLMRTKIGKYHCVDRLADEERDFRGAVSGWRACVQTIDNAPGVGGTVYSVKIQDPVTGLTIEGGSQTQFAMPFQWMTWVVDIMTKGVRAESLSPRRTPLTRNLRQPASASPLSPPGKRPSNKGSKSQSRPSR